MKFPLALLFLLGLLAGCSTVDVRTESVSDLRGFHHIFVRSASNDSNGLDQVIVRELQGLGYDASAGPRTMMPDNADLVIDYEGRWDWDFRTYLFSLTYTVRNARTDVKLGGGSVTHPGVTSKSPEELVHVALRPLFAPKK